MEKTPTVNLKKANKQPKTKKKPPLRVVYITNPIKFNASASEFRALVQELTGQDADIPETSRFAVADGVGGGQEMVASAAKVVAEGNVHAEEVGKVGQSGEGKVGRKRSDLSTFGSYDDDDEAFYDPEMWSIQGFEASNIVWYGDENLDVFKA